MNALDKAIDDLGAVWSVDGGNADGYFILVDMLYKCYGKGNVRICTRAEFEARVKERTPVRQPYMYGVKYSCNGKRPDLPDDVVVKQFYHGKWLLKSLPVSEWSWDHVTGFEIVDERYKPKGQDNFLNTTSRIDVIGQNGNTGEHYEVTWFERGEFPPVGTECEVSNCGNPFVWCKIKYMGSHLCVVDYKTHVDQHYHLGSVKFRPIRTEREKFQGAAIELFRHNQDATIAELMGLMFDAGFKAPEVKQ